MQAARWGTMAAALSVAAALFATWPLGRYVDRAIVTRQARCADPAGCADTKRALWAVTEGGLRLYSKPARVFEAGIFHPLRHAMAFGDPLLGLGALAAPVGALAQNPLVGFNVVYLATYALTGLGVFLLVHRLTAMPAAALVAALGAVLATERWDARGDVARLATLWLPFVLHAALCCLARPTVLRACWTAATAGASGLASAYQAVALPLVLVPWLAVTMLSRRWRAGAWAVTLAALAAGGIAAGAAQLPRVIAWQEVSGDAQPRDEAVRDWLRQTIGESRAMPAAGSSGGPPDALHVLCLLLVAAGVALGWRRRLPGGEPWGSPLLAVLAAAGATAAVGLTRDASWVWPVTSLLAAVAGGIAFSVVAGRASGRLARGAAALLVAAVVVVESPGAYAPTPLTPMPEVTAPPAVYRWLARRRSEAAILELPAGEPLADADYMVHALGHRRPLVNGLSPLGVQVPMVSSFPHPSALMALAEAGVDLVLVHHHRFWENHALRRRLAGRVDLRQEEVGGTGVLHVVRPPGPLAPKPLREWFPVERSAWRLTAGHPAIADGDLDTHWRVESPRPDDLIEIELEGVWAIAGVTIRLGPHLDEYPRDYVVRGSLKQGKWRRIGHAHGAPPPLGSYLHDHRDVDMALAVRVAAVRRLSIAFEGASGPLGIHEIILHGEQIGGPPPESEGP